MEREDRFQEGGQIPNTLEVFLLFPNNLLFLSLCPFLPASISLSFFLLPFMYFTEHLLCADHDLRFRQSLVNKSMIPILGKLRALWR